MNAKILSGAVALATALALASCGSSEKQAAPPAQPTAAAENEKAAAEAAAKIDEQNADAEAEKLQKEIGADGG